MNSHTTPTQFYLTAWESKYRLSAVDSGILESEGFDNSPRIQIDTKQRFQTILGFGGAFTESAASVFYMMPKDIQKQIISDYFHPELGIGYTFGRTHINSCDFSLGNYSYVTDPKDEQLITFDISRDKKQIIPMIRLAENEVGKKLHVMASPWSPPPWMKSNGEMNNGGKLLPSFRSLWAKYICRYITEFEKAGIPIWGLTVQNEPEACQTWDSCLYSAEEERDFIKNFLGPELHRSGLHDKKLIIWDHNRDKMLERGSAILSDHDAAKFVWGTGFHWYCGNHFENVEKLHHAFPDKHLIFTEGCQEGGLHLGSWDLGERYARSIINDLNRWTCAWIDWNLILDELGGPNHVGNFCSAPIIADTRTGEIHKQSSYYYMGHFSKFIPPGSTRVYSSSSVPQVEVLAAITPDGNTTTVILNTNREEVLFQIDLGNQILPISQPGRSILTIVQESAHIE